MYTQSSTYREKKAVFLSGGYREKAGVSQKKYEKADHLGSVRVVFSDRRNGDSVEVLQAFSYYPYGMTSEKVVSGSGYRHGYQGSEKDKEIDPTGNTYTTYYRPLDTRRVIWKARDPKATAWESPYATMGRNPILNTDVRGDTLDVGDDEQSREDVLSLVSPQNRKYISFDNGRVNISSEVNIAESKDEGLKLVGDLVTSPKKFYYEATEVAEVGNDIAGQPSHLFLAADATGILNLSNQGLNSNDESESPRDGYDGQVSLSTKATYFQKNSIGVKVVKSRSSIVFHELAENYERTHNGVDYNGNKSNGGFGAHYRAKKRENNWWNASITPGEPSDFIHPDKYKSVKKLSEMYRDQLNRIYGK